MSSPENGKRCVNGAKTPQTHPPNAKSCRHVKHQPPAAVSVGVVQTFLRQFETVAPAMAACAVCNNGIKLKMCLHLPLPVLRNLPAGRVGSGRCCCESTISAAPPIYLSPSKKVNNQIEGPRAIKKQSKKCELLTQFLIALQPFFNHKKRLKNQKNSPYRSSPAGAASPTEAFFRHSGHFSI
jgi:hypothetical protein